VRELVRNKRRWSASPNPEDARLGFPGWHERGYLPHRDEPGLTQFVTFRLADAFPAALRSEWAALLEIEDDRQRRQRIEAYLDQGRGPCHLRRADMAGLVEQSLRLFHGGRYDLRAWVVMPNHVHVLFKVDRIPMAKIVEGWKSCTARAANRLLEGCGARTSPSAAAPKAGPSLERATGLAPSGPVRARRLPAWRQFWAEGYWDTFMRDSEHELKTRHYIENNPTKAGLVCDPKHWPWSSARFRDNYSVLLL